MSDIKSSGHQCESEKVADSHFQEGVLSRSWIDDQSFRDRVALSYRKFSSKTFGKLLAIVVFALAVPAVLG